jgi:hypothetical protein
MMFTVNTFERWSSGSSRICSGDMYVILFLILLVIVRDDEFWVLVMSKSTILIDPS